jgi:hypothetical protein
VINGCHGRSGGWLGGCLRVTFISNPIMLHLRFSSFVTVFLVAIAFSAPSRVLGDTIIDTGPGPSAISGPSLSNDGLGDFQNLAGKVTLTADTTITSIEGWIGTWDADDTGSISIGIGASIDDMIFSYTYAVSATLIGPMWQGIDGLSWSLAAGDYWVTFQANQGVAGWMPSGVPNPLGQYAFSSPSSGGWQPMVDQNFGIRIEGETSSRVPDSTSTAVLFGMSLLGLFRLRQVRMP